MHNKTLYFSFSLFLALLTLAGVLDLMWATNESLRVVQARPVATLFCVVHSSGVVGVDEKLVLVPKNDKPAGKRKRWMYVYWQ
jgi:hypothetical protein